MFKVGTLHTVYLLLPLSLLPFIILSTRKRVPQWTVTDDYVNITLQITGACRQPVTYVGIDSRRHLLNYYDISAFPLGEYSPAKLNWGRVVLLKEIFNRCDHVEYLMYSDTDAYIHARRQTYRSLKQLKSVVYQQGMWKLNSGFSAWRNSRRAKRVLNEWHDRYSPVEDFFAEQRALLHAVGNNSKLCEKTANGFLGWHIKGPRLFKTELANIARFLSYYEDVIAVLLWLPFAVFIVFALYMILKVRFTGSTQGVRPFVQIAVLLGRFLRSDMFVFVCANVVMFILLITKTDFLGEWRLYTADSVSQLNFTHVIPGGRLLINKKFLCYRYWCIKPTEGFLSASLHAILTKVTMNRSFSLVTFFLYGVFEILLSWFLTALLWAAWLTTGVCLIAGAVNLCNVFVMHDVADGNFGRKRQISGKWQVGGVKPRAKSGMLEVHDG